jgi:hypothetical protein
MFNFNTARKMSGLLGAAAIAVAVLAHPVARHAGSTPVVLQTVPAVPAPASLPQTIEIDGRDFQTGLSVILWTPDGGTAEFKEKAIQGQSETAFKVTVLLNREGTYAVTVTNRDGGVSPPFAFRVKAGAQAVSAR